MNIILYFLATTALILLIIRIGLFKPKLIFVPVAVLLLFLLMFKAYSIYLEYSYSSPEHSPLLRVVSPSDKPDSPVYGEEPVRVVADSVGIDISVLNPASTEKDVLETAMLKSAVRYPTSVLLGQEGTVFLFGHSSNVPFVRNKGYKAFNELQKLKNGDIVRVYSDRNEYRYVVTGIRLVKNEVDTVELTSDGRRLILVTTDLRDKTFNTRWLVEADLI